MKKIIITIDGWSSCGKSTLAKQMARALQYRYIDSGAMYRAITLFFLRNRVDWTKEEEVNEALKNIELDFCSNENTGETEIYLNGENVEYLIRDLIIAEKVSEVAAIGAVRIFAVAQQRKMGEQRGIVMDGRDIGTVVFPDAELKIFMTADNTIRVERRFRELFAQNPNITIEEVKNNLEMRDYIDSHREISPLQKADDAIVLDNSNISPEQQLEMALSFVNQKVQLQLMSQLKLRVAVVGYGISARVFHLPFITMLADRYQLVSILQRKGKEAQEKYPDIRIAKDIDELISNPDIDLIVITTPNDTHFPFAMKALEAGKHVVLEKPFTNTTEEARQLVNIAARSGKLLSVYQNRRYVSDFRTIKDILDKKLLGDIHEFEAHYDRYRAEARPNAWREAVLPGSGILYDIGAHIIDQALYFFGMPLSVTADIRMQRPHSKVDDYFVLWLDYAFTKVILHAGMLVREPGPRYMIQGTKGSFIKYGEDPQEARLRAGDAPQGDDWGKEPENMYGLIHTEMNGKIIREKYPSHSGSYADYYKELYESIINDKPVREKPEHGYNIIRIIELAMQSHQERRTIQCTELIDIPY